MDNRINRRNFLQGSAATAATLALAGSWTPAWAADAPGPGAPNAEKIGWLLGCQAYSFNRFTFYEAVDKVASLGLHTIEMYPGQKLSAEKPDVQVGEGLSESLRKEVLQYLSDKGVTLRNYGVVGLPAEEAACRKTFEFAKAMGIETIVSEPGREAFDTIEKLCDEYQISVALHNHPEPSPYWNPDTVLEVCQNRTKRIGACADTGHWMRSGINPIDALKKLEGRIISFHLKDLNKYGKQGAHDVPWGTGEAKMADMLAEIKRQDFKGVFSIEYEHNWLESLPEIAQCVAFFDKTAAELAKA